MATDTSDGWPDMERELTCSICTDILYQPLTLLDCLHTFCGSCLKEWFAWQATAATQGRSRGNVSSPYTCPQCRDTVRGTKADWRLTTLLEGYLKAHPGQGKTEDEKEEMGRHYQPGEDVVPPVTPQQADSEDEHLLAGVREMSLRDMDAGSTRRRPGRVRRGTGPHQDRAVRSGGLLSSGFASPPDMAARRPNEDRQIEHQTSLRSLLSASPVHVGDVQQEILQSIYSEGLLDGIDIDNLTPEQEEELTERIAEAYRRRQRRRERSRNHDRRHTSSQSPSPPVNRPSRGTSSPPEQPSAVARSRPPIARPHLFEQNASAPPRSHRRATSANHQSGRSMTRDENRPVGAPASRSATDLTNRPRTSETERDRRGRMSSQTRSRTEPQIQAVPATQNQSPSQVGNSEGTTTLSSSAADILPHTSNMQLGERTAGALTITPAVTSIRGEGALRPAQSNGALAPEPIESLQILRPLSIPVVSCNRCRRSEIQHELHYHCRRCGNGDFDLCLACYRDGRGCDHWFGFGFMAHERWRRLEPVDGWPSGYELPHVLDSRRYLRPQNNGPKTASGEAYLQEGAFCEICLTPCDDYYWSCGYCMEGAWGYCKTCVQQGRHCTHPLLPVARLPSPHPARDTKTPPAAHLPHLRHRDEYVPVPDATDCDLCRRPIPATNTRYHCYKCSNGNYDICTECYYGLVATGKIRQANGPNGWRRCLQGHRMVIVGFQDIPGRGQQRVTVRDPVGGWRYRDRLEGNSTHSHAEISTESSVNDTGSSNTHHTVSDSGHPSSPPPPPPPDGTLGLRCLAAWNRFPPGQVTDELHFPKNAEIREVENKNVDWCLGVYAGQVGLFPSNHVRIL